MRRTATEPTPTADASSKLSFKLDELQPPRHLDLELNQEFLNLLLQDSKTPFRGVGGVHLTGELGAVDHGAVLRGELLASVATDCKRCLVPVTVALRLPLTVRYVPQSELEARQQRSDRGEDRSDSDDEPGEDAVDARDLDEEPFEGKRISLTTTLREHVILGLPMGVVCKEECQGLCASCGQNLNEKTCECRGDSIDPRWGRLKELKLTN